jgi:F0F1-type ATP synthase epsilon subunit
MTKYTNDWATEAIARQYMKNKRSYAVQRGFLEVDAKYDYLKANAAKRSDAPRGNGADKRKAGSQALSQVSKKARLAKTKGKAKEKTQVEGDDEEEDEEESGDEGKKGEEFEDDEDIED